MRVEVTKAYGPYRVGTVIPDMPNNQARELIRRGLVRDLSNDQMQPMNRKISAGRRQMPMKAVE
jgi:hypothetical protein